MLLPLPLYMYEGNVKKGYAKKSDKQLKKLIKEKHIPTSYVEETGKEVSKKEYHSISMPSVKKSYSVPTQPQKDVEFIKGFV